MNECGSERAYDNIAAGAFENKFSKHHNNITILLEDYSFIHQKIMRWCTNAQISAKDINLHFERWILNIEFLQQETQAVCSPLLPERSGEAACFQRLSMGHPNLWGGLRFD